MGSDALRLFEQNGQEHHRCQRPGVIEILKGCYGRDSGERGGEEGLRAVGDEALRDARAGVEQAGGLARRYAIAMGDVARERAHGDDGHGVVSSAEVYEADNHSDAGLCTSGAGDACGETLQEVVDATHGLDDAEEA